MVRRLLRPSTWLRLIALGLTVALLYYTAAWHFVSLFIWRNPMLTWLPIVAFYAIGFLWGLAAVLLRGGGLPLASATTGATGTAAPSGEGARGLGGDDFSMLRAAFSARGGVVAGLVVFLIGLGVTIFAAPKVPLAEIDYSVVERLPETTQPRLLPRTSVDDDPDFDDTREVHLVRDPRSGELIWTGEWRSSLLGKASGGYAYKSLSTIQGHSEIIQGGFDHSVGGWTPGTLRSSAFVDHPFSAVQYPVVTPLAGDGASGDAVIAIAPYLGYNGFPFRYPYLAGVLVYHADGELEDLSPEAAASRDELASSGRLFPEKLARAQAEALAASEKFEGKIVDGDDNKQPYLTAISAERAVWVTVINEDSRNGAVKAVVLADSTTGQTDVWTPPPGSSLISTERAVNTARALPLQWEERRCCDSDGNYQTVKLREVVEPRLVFKAGKPYYLVSIVPTDELVLNREIEYTLLLDATTGETIEQFDHVDSPEADKRLEAFFRPDAP